MISPKQCKMARAAVGWGVRELAEAASVDKATISRYERGGDVYASTIEKLELALVSTGEIEFQGINCVCLIDLPKP